MFTDHSTPVGTVVSWEWDFGDGGTSTAQNPSHVYTNIGFYTVTLIVTSNTGCKSVISAGNYIRIVGGVTTDFSFAPPTTCRAPFDVNFTNGSDGPGAISYSWDFGNSTTSTAVNPTATYASPGTYTVRLNAVSDLGCTGSQSKTVTINPTVTDFNVPASICLNQPVSFQNTSSPAPVSASWDFGDGTGTAQINPSKTFLTPGNYNVRLINQYEGCIDSAFHPVTVADKPAVAFTAVDTANCQAPFTVQFNDQTPGATAWLWDFGDGTTSTEQNPLHTYTTEGDFNVSLTATTATGCTNTLVKTPYVLIHPTTVRINVPTGGCVPFRYTPLATINTLDPVISWAWDLGEPGAQFNVQNPPSYQYNNTGAYTVSLTITTASGCVVNTSIPAGVRVGTPAVVDFTPISGTTCARDPISFSDHTVFPDPNFSQEWLWDFGDGTTSSEQNPIHQFEDTGNLVVTLIALNNRCPATVTHTIRVNAPIADFDYMVNCGTGMVTFTDNSMYDHNIPVTFLWNFGDGQTSTVQNPPPHFFPPGIYNVSLTVTNGLCDYTFNREIKITAEPADFNITRTPACKNEIFTMTAIGVNAANISRYQWVIGIDTIPVEGATVTYSIPTVGVYNVTLVLTDINGCKTIVPKPNFLSINGPAANFTTAGGACYGKTFTFADGSTPNPGIRDWIFDFGDGIKDTLHNAPFTHIYNQLGAFDVSLTVVDNAGCTDSYTLPSQILVTNPIAGFRADTFYCPQTPLQFVDTSSGVGLNYLWTFGDGNTSTLQNPENSYPNGDATYSVKLVITDLNGCQDSVSKNNYIRIASPKAAFEITDTTTICPPLRTGFIFQGKDYESWIWDFGDGGSSTVQSPSHFYSGFGHFVPTLTLFGPGGCSNAASATVSVYDPYSARINYGPITRACNSLNVDFDITLPPGFKYYFSFGDGTLDSSGRTSFSHFYPRPSFNQPILFMTDTAQGCQAAVAGSPRIDVLGAIPLFGKDKEEFCDQGTVQFKDFTTKNEAIQSTLWTFGNAGTSTATDPSFNFTQPGLYEVTLEITTISNCTSSYKDTVLVYRTPAPSIISRDTICINVTEPFTAVLAQADTSINYQWTFGNGQTGKDSISNATFTTGGAFPVTLTATNKIGCTASSNKSIYVAIPPTGKPVQNPITIISGGSAPLAMTYTGNIANYNWSPATGLNCVDCPIPTATPRFTTKYNLELSDVFGCRSSSEVTVNVVCNNLNYFVPNTFSPNGDGHNETFFARGTGLFSIKSFTVFNRWGQIVFEKKNMAVNDPGVGWNGTFNGQKASPDVYVYIIEILCDNGTVVPVKGNVTLLR